MTFETLMNLDSVLLLIFGFCVVVDDFGFVWF